MKHTEKIASWGDLLVKNGFVNGDAGKLISWSSLGDDRTLPPKYFRIIGIGELIEIFLPNRLIRIHAQMRACENSGREPIPGQFTMSQWVISDPRHPKNEFFQNPRSGKLKECKEGEITHLLKKL